MSSNVKFKLKKETSHSLKNAKGWTFSNKFIVSFTGTKANVFDKSLNLIHTFTDLKYVYKGYISDDETKLLLVSSSNVFYVFSLETFILIQKYSLKGRFNNSLDGCGAWNFDNNTFIINAVDKYSVHSCIMLFSTESTAPLKQIEFNDHCFVKVLKLDHLKKHLLLGVDHSKEHKNCLLYLQNDDIEEYIIEDFDDFILDAEYNSILDKYIVYGGESAIICDKRGILIRPLDIGRIIGTTSSFVEKWLDEINITDEDKLEMLQNILGFIGSDSDVYENINRLLWSKNFNVVFGATSDRFFICDKTDKEIVFSKKFPYGVYDLLEISDNRVILQTWNGAGVYKIERVKHKG